jgi:hypothetical protein
MQTPTELGWRFVTLGVITPGAGGDHIFPLVTTPSTAGHDMVDGFSGSAAIGAPSAVPGEDGSPRQTYVRAVWNPDKSG